MKIRGGLTNKLCVLFKKHLYALLFNFLIREDFIYGSIEFTASLIQNYNANKNSAGQRLRLLNSHTKIRKGIRKSFLMWRTKQLLIGALHIAWHFYGVTIKVGFLVVHFHPW